MLSIEQQLFATYQTVRIVLSELPDRGLIARLRVYAPFANLSGEGGFQDNVNPVAKLLVAIGTRYHFSVSVWR